MSKKLIYAFIVISLLLTPVIMIHAGTPPAVQKELDDCKAERTKLQEDNNNLRDERGTLNSTITKLEGEKRQLERRIAELENLIASIDEEAIVIGFFNKHDEPLALLVNISNHTDSVGGTEISADWPGFMERHVEEKLGTRVNVITLIAAQGNINHYDFDSLRKQTSHGEAERIGRAYGEMIVSNLPACRKMAAENLHAVLSYIDIAPREIGRSELEEARKIIEAPESADQSGDLKAEDLAAPAVLRIFAAQLLALHDTMPRFYSVPLQIIRIGKLYLCAIPGEPFVEIGLQLKKSAGHDTVVPVSLANGYFGYIPLEESFDHGGYEIKQGIHNCLSRKAAGIVVKNMKDMMKKITAREAV